MPIRLRVTLAFSGVMAILLVALGLFVYLRFRSHLDATIDQGLRSRADDVGLIVTQSDADLREGKRLLPSRESFAQLLTPRGRIIDSTPGLGGAPLLSDAERAAAVRGQGLVDRGASPPALRDPVRLLARPIHAHGRDLVIVVGSATDDRADALRNLRTVLLIGGPVALILASLAGYGMAAAALRPVEAMRRRAAAISAAEPDERLPVPESRDELARLGLTLNSMLDRLATALERERTFVDDASHELRTPLAMHKTELELALRYGGSASELRAAIASAVEEADRLGQLAEDLLVVARSDKGRLALDLQPVDVRELLDAVRERFAQRAAEAGREIAVDAPSELRVDGDPLRLEQALTNLVDNALRHGRGEIRLRAAAAGEAVRLHVEDGGSGLPPEFVERAFERFTRADSGRAGGGSGLGLAIVAAIAQAHRGSCGAASRPGGGADVWIELPAAGPGGGSGVPAAAAELPADR